MEHLRLLPCSFDMLAHWSEEELALLQEVSLRQTAQRLRAQVRQDYEAAMRAAERAGVLRSLEEAQVDFEAFLWAKREPQRCAWLFTSIYDGCCDRYIYAYMNEYRVRICM